MLEVGVSTACFYPETTEEALAEVARTGAKVAEVFFNTFSELEPDYLRELRAFADAEGVRVVSVHPFTSEFEHMLFFTEYERRTRDAVRLYEKFFIAAQYLGAQYFVLHGDSVRGHFIGMERYCAALERLCRRGRDFGVTVTLENIVRSRSGHPDFLKSVRGAMPPGLLGFTLDIKQAVRAKVDPLAVAEAMGPDLRHVHINDYDKNGCKLPFCGDLDLRGFVREIVEKGYIGDFMIEVYHDNFTATEQLSHARCQFVELIAQIRDETIK